MAIRLVSDDGELFWFHGYDWQWLLWFASHYGWKWDRQTIRREHPPMNEKYEWIGCAHFEAVAAQILADAVERGITYEPVPKFLLEEMERRKKANEEKAKAMGYDPLARVQRLIQRWSEFPRFARRGGFRVDETD